MLSSSWRYRWSTIPHLVLDYPLKEEQDVREYEVNLVYIVDQILLLHSGPIRKFHLVTNLESCSDHIDRWLLVLSRNGITDFTLRKEEGGPYLVPSCLFSCAALTSLALCDCKIRLPASIKRFDALTDMDLNGADISSEDLHKLISICPRLSQLRLVLIPENFTFKISGLNLEYLWIQGQSIKDICFENTPNLDMLILWDDGVGLNKTSCNLIQLLPSLPSLSKLILYDQTFQIWAQGDIPKVLPTACGLTTFCMDMDFEDVQELRCAFCIFRSCPLEMIGIQVTSFKNTAASPDDDFWGAQENFGCSFGHLKRLHIVDYTGTITVLKFVQYVLANAPILETVKIKLKEDDAVQRSNTLDKMIRSRRISARAEIEFED